MNTICLKKTGSRPEAEILKGALDAQGIEAWVIVDDGGGVYPGLNWSKGVEVHVRPEDLSQAQAFLEELSK